MARGKRRSLWSRDWLVAGAIVSVIAVSSWRNTDFSAPPRFDGAGYMILAESLSTGLGYRGIDHPDAPRHAHFPPGYPAALAGFRRITGSRSVASTHGFSVICTVAATLAAWRWFRTMYHPEVAGLLGLSLAMNWTWGRTSGSIQSEPLFVLLESLTLLAAVRTGRVGGIGTGIGLGAFIGVTVLTRHVGVALAAAVVVSLIIQRRRIAAVSASVTAVIVILPWIAWLATVRENTQAELVGRSAGGTARLIASQAIFHMQRIPDQLIGPFVEVGTVFSRSRGLGLVVNGWALLATCVVVLGWLRTLRTRRRRLSGLTALGTLALLLVWPFTEAGRFLIPLAPCLLVGAVEGLSPILACIFPNRGGIRKRAATLVLLATFPYASYSLWSNRARAQSDTHADFDSACEWIASQTESPGPVLTRHPGEVYCQTRRRALAPISDDPEAIASEILRYRVAYLLVDDDRYANAPENPLATYTREHGRDLRLVWSRHGSSGSSVRIFEVEPTGLTH